MATKLDTLLSRMTDLGNETVAKNLMSMIYGKPGTGKTVLSVGLAKYICPEGKRVLYIDTKEGWVSIENHPEMMDGVSRFQYKNFGDLTALAEAIDKGSKGFDDIGVVIIDELSTACDGLMDEIWREANGLTKTEISTIEIEGKLYKPLQDATMQVLNAFERLDGVHVIVTAHEREVVDHRKVKVIKPDFTPKNGSAIQKLMHLTAHMTSEIKGAGKKTSYERSMQSHPSALVDAKSRIGGMPLSCEPGIFVQVIHDWLNDEEAVFLAEEEQELAPDNLPEEGIPVAESDDEPAFQEEV